MKRIIIVICVLFSFIGISAQNFTEVVHLKNGSVIKGVIVEQVPNESLKIKTQDGSLFVFQMDEISKISKDFSSSSLSKTTKKSDGYRGFVDFNYSLGVGDWEIDRLELTTSHGYQITPIFYIGAGVGVNYYYDSEAFSMPIFANPRIDFPTGNINPFIDVKIGYSVIDVEGFYLSPTLGVRFNLQNNVGLNLGVGYTMQNTEGIAIYESGYSDYDTFNMGAITFKIGVDF